ncbi:Hsp20/alpha crystallin family protein [Lacinutrix sp. Hel_I_90]|uniref:Hsp20/alpha crystallin family protein n=1 Tax=Lacinutrix sp. Hel_I_90 TaxID=1249999 RepID=UPI0005C8BA5A|nr:Hsp20/alpha crystallin family protein [Lacinutrix sp. Hel_I_90]
MSLIKFNNTNRLFPWSNTSLKDFLGSDDFFNNDFFEEDSLMPAMNVKENTNDFQIEFAAPGFNKKDFEVTIEDNVLHVYGEKSTKEEEKDNDYTRKEFSYNSFKRSLTLPKTIDLDQKVKATYKDGILHLDLMKKEEAEKLQTKKIVQIA